MQTPEVEPVGASEAQKVGFWGPLNLGGWFLGFVEAAAGWLLAGVVEAAAGWLLAGVVGVAVCV